MSTVDFLGKVSWLLKKVKVLVSLPLLDVQHLDVRAESLATIPHVGRMDLLFLHIS